MSAQTIAGLRGKANHTPGSAYVSALSLLAGILIMTIYAIVSFGLVGTVADYWSNPKAVRDSAEAGAAVLGQLAIIQSSAAWLEPAKFLGISFILFGIAISFAVSIMSMLKLRILATREFLSAYAKK